MKINLRPPQIDSSSPQLSQRHFWFSLFKQFLPVFVVAALLPVGLAVVLNPQGLTIFSRAQKSQELRLWLEPPTLKVRPGERIKLSVMAEFADDTKLIPTLSLIIESDASVQINPAAISYNKPFRGSLKIATITVTPTQTGVFSVNIPQEKVITTALEAVHIITSPVLLEVQ